MSLIRLENVSLAFGEAPLLDHANLQIEARERIFLIGRNGMGKTCLLKVISGQMPIDEGSIYRAPKLKISELSQNLPDFGNKTVYEVVASGLEETGEFLKKYHELISTPDMPNHDAWLREIEIIQQELEARGGWEFSQNIDEIITRLELPPDKLFRDLSGGWQRRAMLAMALVSKPDLLLLDEPSNHLDLEAIEWLEEFLNDYKGAVLCITHDRTLLQKHSKRILELDRGKLTSWIGNYEKYLKDKEERLEVEAQQAKLFDNVLAKEEAWIRQGIKARRTRNEGRVRALIKLREERAKRREYQGKPEFSANEAMKSGKLVVNAEHISFSFPEHPPIIQDFSISIFRGDKIALIGPNGAGKSTLLKLLLGKIKPTIGKLELGTNLQIAYFDQLRQGIDPALTAVENVAQGRETISIGGKQKHVMSYLGDFLFTPERARTPVKMLSGGECNRLLLAKLFSLPSNLLVLDEPTNDLDIESLELLESILVDYQGTVLLVSHDRSFVDEVATGTLFFAGQGRIIEFVGGYSDIPKEMRQSLKFKAMTANKTVDHEPLSSQSSSIQPQIRPQSRPQSSFRLKRELESLPDKISKLETDLHTLQLEVAAPNFYANSEEYIKEKLSLLKNNQETLEGLYRRWEELENPPE